MGTDDVTMVFTDVQGSTSLWEANPAAMEQALQLHDSCIRQMLAKHSGYEVTTEGDAFQVCFHSALEAVGFCLDVQTALVSLDWDAETLKHPDAAVSEDGAWRGLRVRMGVHSGKPASVTKHEMTGRWRYVGNLVAMAKAVEGVCHGGQIIVSQACFSLVDGLLTQLGSPQVTDLGEHLLRGDGIADPSSGKEGRAAIRLLQLLPESVACNYSQPVGSEGGRRFPALPTEFLLSPGFEEAPAGQSITLCFVFTKGATELAHSLPTVAAAGLGMVRRCVRAELQSTCGYECQEDEGAFMLAFQTMVDAATFGMNLHRALRQLSWPIELRARGGLRVAVGALAGGYTSRRPHASTGRADYFGTIVNRTARIAAAAHAGQVLLGGDDPMPETPRGATVRRLGAFILKGIDSPMMLSELRADDDTSADFPEPRTKGRVPA